MTDTPKILLSLTEEIETLTAENKKLKAQHKQADQIINFQRVRFHRLRKLAIENDHGLYRAVREMTDG